MTTSLITLQLQPRRTALLIDLDERPALDEIGKPS